MNPAPLDYLLECWQSTERALRWLERSYRLSPQPPYEKASEEEWDQLEALSGRYARVADILMHKLFRALDRYEFEASGSLLDAANRAVKRGLVDSVNELREMKDLRNEIVHEYAIEDLAALYAEIYRMTPDLIDLVKRVGTYLRETHSGEPRLT